MTFYCKCGHEAEVIRGDGNTDPYFCERCGSEMSIKKPSIIERVKRAVKSA